jgi:hypothetical protein
MDDGTDPDNPAPVSEEAVAEVSMHHLFEIQLMTNQIVGDSTAENRINLDWVVKRQHVRRYLINYHREHAVLPTGRRYLGMTRPRNLEIGMVDLDAIRQQIRADSVIWNDMNFESLAVIEDALDYSVNSEIKTGMRLQSAGKDPSGSIFDLRQELARRGEKPD